ncbi:MAG TPA: hypothetical protein VF650_04425 [Allosphingosinicella sp.]|jgi:hypothetical protein
MNPSSQAGVLSLDAARRAKHALLFLGATMSGGQGQSLSRLGSPVAPLRYFQRPDIDIGVVRGAGPPSREVVAWVKRRQVACMIGRLWEREPFAELTVDTYFADGAGAGNLDNLHLWTSDSGDRFWLAGRLNDPLLLKLTRDGPVPTLSRPFRDEDGLARGKTNADRLLSALLWPSPAR